RIWMAGGLLGPKHATRRTEFYDPTVDVWSLGPPLPIALHHAMMVAYQNTLWVIGGFTAQGSKVLAGASARVLKLNPAQTGWTDGPPLHYARGAAAAAVGGNKIGVVGGGARGAQPRGEPTNDFDGATRHERPANLV